MSTATLNRLRAYIVTYGDDGRVEFGRMARMRYTQAIALLGATPLYREVCVVCVV